MVVLSIFHHYVSMSSSGHSPCGIILADFFAAEVKKEDPTSKMLLSAAEQEKREVETRHRSVKLVEQCIMIAKRTCETP